MSNEAGGSAPLTEEQQQQQLLEEQYPPAKRQQFNEPLKFLPVILVTLTILGLWAIYSVFHCFPLMQWDLPDRLVAWDQKTRGTIQFGVHCFFTLMLITCYLRAILTNPGEVPDDDPRWQYEPSDGIQRDPLEFCETKRSGERRDCKWCAKYKPDRAHHCRTCTTCVLKMDHHCPWIYNCIGFHNYKFFFLTIVYAVCACQLITWTMLESAMRTIEKDEDFFTMFMTLFGLTLSFFLGFLLLGFLCFHCWLVGKSITTIEWCESKMRKEGQEDVSDVSPYSRGVFRNFQDTLGENPMLWLLPIGGPPGQGTDFKFDAKRLGRAVEEKRGIKFNAGSQFTEQSNLDYDGHVYSSYMKQKGYAGHGFAG